MSGRMTKRQVQDRLTELAYRRSGDDERWIREAAASVVRAFPNGGDDVRIPRRSKVMFRKDSVRPWDLPPEPLSVIVPRAGVSQFDACLVVEEQIRAQVDD